jgi:hypothetical protein
VPLTLNDVIYDLTYINYACNRDAFPDKPVENWARIYPKAAELEARYQAEKAIGKARFE